MIRDYIEKYSWISVALGILIASIGLFGAGKIAHADPFTTGEHVGFFLRDNDPFGDSVIEEGLNASHNPNYRFTNFIADMRDALYRTGNKTGQQNPVGAAFIIITMLGYTQSSPQYSNFNTRAEAVAFARANFDRWRDDIVRPLHDAGKINYNQSFTYRVNTYWQGNGQGSNPDDVSWYTPGVSTDMAIVIRDFANNTYAIKHSCGNPVGSMDRLVVRPSFDINGYVTARNTVTGATRTGNKQGGARINFNVAQGQSLQFRYFVQNEGTQSTNPLDITAKAWNSTSSTLIRQVNMGVVGAGVTREVTAAGSPAIPETINVPLTATVGSTYCRSVRWTPSSQSFNGESGSALLCAVVTATVIGADCVPDLSFAPSADLEAGVATTITMGYENVSPFPGSVGGTVTITPPSGGAASFTPTFTGSAGNLNASVNYTPPVNGSYTVSYRAGTLESCPGEFNVSARPYVKFFGGDVYSGVTFDGDLLGCSSSAPYTTLRAFNRGASAGYAGSGTNMASSAIGAIQGFSSGVGATVPGGSPGDPRKLAFANVGGGFGGNFNYAHCLPDFWSTKGSTPAVTTNKVIGQNPENPANPIPNPRNKEFSAGEKQDIFVDGHDVFIRGNVIYRDGVAWDLSNVPAFRLVVRGGNIYIHPEVTQLDGLYVALPDGSGDKGIIYTCAVGFQGPTAAQMADPAVCGRAQLRVYGAFVAQQVKLLRTFGTVGSATAGEDAASTKAAEVFIHSPAVWMSMPEGSVNTGTSVDAITSMPPIL